MVIFGMDSCCCKLHRLYCFDWQAGMVWRRKWNFLTTPKRSLFYAEMRKTWSSISTRQVTLHNILVQYHQNENLPMKEIYTWRKKLFDSIFFLHTYWIKVFNICIPWSPFAVIFDVFKKMMNDKIWKDRHCRFVGYSLKKRQYNDTYMHL